MKRKPYIPRLQDGGSVGKPVKKKVHVLAEAPIREDFAVSSMRAWSDYVSSEMVKKYDVASMIERRELAQKELHEDKIYKGLNNAISRMFDIREATGYQDEEYFKRNINALNESLQEIEMKYLGDVLDEFDRYDIDYDSLYGNIDARDKFLRENGYPVPITKRDDVFIKNAETLASKLPDYDVNITPLYGEQAKVDSVARTVAPGDYVSVMGHAGHSLAGIPQDKIAQSFKDNIAYKEGVQCLLGTCSGDRYMNDMAKYSGLKTFGYDNAWHGPLGVGNTPEEVMYGYEMRKEPAESMYGPAELEPNTTPNYTLKWKGKSFKDAPVSSADPPVLRSGAIIEDPPYTHKTIKAAGGIRVKTPTSPGISSKYRFNQKTNQIYGPDSRPKRMSGHFVKYEDRPSMPNDIKADIVDLTNRTKFNIKERLHKRRSINQAKDFVGSYFPDLNLDDFGGVKYKKIKDYNTYADYNPSNQRIRVFPRAIFNFSNSTSPSIAHEMVHYRQDMSSGNPSSASQFNSRYYENIAHSPKLDIDESAEPYFRVSNSIPWYEQQASTFDYLMSKGIGANDNISVPLDRSIMSYPDFWKKLNDEQAVGLMNRMRSNPINHMESYPIPKLKKGGIIGDPPNGDKLSKLDAYWLAVHGSPENAGKDHKMWKYVWKELYEKPVQRNIQIFSEDVANMGPIVENPNAPKSKVLSKATGTTAGRAYNKKQIGYFLNERGLRNILGKTRRIMNVLVPGVEDMPVIPLAVPELNQRQQMAPKKLQSGGVVEGDEDKQMVEHSKQTDKYAWDFLNNWWSDPSAVERAKAQGLAKGHLDEARNRINRSDLKYYNLPAIKKHFGTGTSVVPVKNEQGITTSWKKVSGKYDTGAIEKDLLGAAGMSYSDRVIVGQRGFKPHDIPIHELTHQTPLDESQAKVFQKHLTKSEYSGIKTNLLNKYPNIYTEKNDLDAEMYPRIMEWRYLRGFKPDHRYNLKDAQDLKINFDLFKDVPDDKMLNILNELVMAPSVDQAQSYKVAKKGAHIPKAAGGLVMDDPPWKYEPIEATQDRVATQYQMPYQAISGRKELIREKENISNERPDEIYATPDRTVGQRAENRYAYVLKNTVQYDPFQQVFGLRDEKGKLLNEGEIKMYDPTTKGITNAGMLNVAMIMTTPFDIASLAGAIKAPLKKSANFDLAALRKELAENGILKSQKTPNLPWKEPIRKAIEPWGYHLGKTAYHDSKIKDLIGAFFGGRNPKYLTEEQWIAQELKRSLDRSGYKSPPGSITNEMYTGTPDVSKMPAINKIKSYKEALNFRDANRIQTIDGKPQYFDNIANRYTTWDMYLGKPQTKHPMYDISELTKSKDDVIYTIKKDFMNIDGVEDRFHHFINIANKTPDEFNEIMLSRKKNGERIGAKPWIKKGDKYIIPEQDYNYFGTMGGFHWEMSKLPDGNYKFIANDVWDLQPFKGKSGVNSITGKIIDKIAEPLGNIEVGRALGIGKPLNVKVGFIVDKDTKKIINTFGLVPTAIGAGVAYKSKKPVKNGM